MAASTDSQCRATLPPSLDASEIATRLAPYLWTHPFPLLSPQSCFVLDDGTGRAVGYVIGHADVSRMARDYTAYTELIGGTSTDIPGVLPASIATARRDVGPCPAQLDVLEPWNLPADPDSSAPFPPVNETCLLQQAYNPRWLLLESAKTELKAGVVRAYPAIMHIDLLPSHQAAGWGRKMINAFLQAIAAEGARGLHIGISGENTKVVAFYERCGFRIEPGGEIEGGVWMVRDVE